MTFKVRCKLCGKRVANDRAQTDMPEGFVCFVCVPAPPDHPVVRYSPTYETAGEAAQRYERRLRDAVLDELVDWLSEEDGTHVAIRDVLEHINTIRTRKP